MRFLGFISLVALLSLAGSCAPPRSNPVLFEQEVRDWTPIGTPVEEAARIMRSRGFSVLHADGSDGGGEYLSCTRYRVLEEASSDTEWRVRTKGGIETEWRVLHTIEDGKVVSITTDTQTRER